MKIVGRGIRGMLRQTCEVWSLRGVVPDTQWACDALVLEETSHCQRCDCCLGGLSMVVGPLACYASVTVMCASWSATRLVESSGARGSPCPLGGNEVLWDAAHESDGRDGFDFRGDHCGNRWRDGGMSSIFRRFLFDSALLISIICCISSPSSLFFDVVQYALLN